MSLAGVILTRVGVDDKHRNCQSSRAGQRCDQCAGHPTPQCCRYLTTRTGSPWPRGAMFPATPLLVLDQVERRERVKSTPILRKYIEQHRGILLRRSCLRCRATLHMQISVRSTYSVPPYACLLLAIEISPLTIFISGYPNNQYGV